MKLKIEMLLKYESAEARTTHERHRTRLLCQFLKGDNISTWKSLEIQCFSRNFDDYCESSQSINFRLTSKVFTLYKIKYSRRKKVLNHYAIPVNMFTYKLPNPKYVTSIYLINVCNWRLGNSCTINMLDIWTKFCQNLNHWCAQWWQIENQIGWIFFHQ